MSDVRVVVCGLAVSVPLGGMGLHYLQYCLGLRDLGVEVLYLEDNWGWPYDPVRGSGDGDDRYNVAWAREMFAAFGLRWAYMDTAGRYHGTSESEVHAFCAGADLLLNVSGGLDPFPHHRKAARLAYVDTDSGWGQVKIAQGDAAIRGMYAAHDLHFTFAQSINEPTCRIPHVGFDWRPTRQPVHLPFWEDPHPPGPAYTTVMNWDAYGEVRWENQRWGQKDASFPLILDLPRRTALGFEVAVAGPAPRDEMRAHGWRVVEPFPISRTIWDLREYVRSSRGEIGIYKEGFVRSRSGWFAERSANYLAAGRPVVAQDTGWSRHLPTGQGLFGFTDLDEAAAAYATIEEDLAHHSEAARRVAREHFDATVVLDELLSDAGVG